MNKIKLRALTASDIEKTFLWHNQEDISDLYSGHPFPVNIEMETKWYEKILKSNFPMTIFGIEVIESNNLIGITVLRDINMIYRSAEFAFYIGDQSERGKGYSKEALILTLRFAFLKLGLQRIYVKILEENVQTIKIHERIGFKREGILRKSVFKNGHYKNELFMGLLEEEFNG
jgi:RimJ/RimL family protein N-acetyltransferase